MGKQWYVIRSKPNKEFFLSNQLEQRKCDVFFPVLKIKPVNPRCRTIVPYFPGYLFLNTDLDHNNVVIFERVPGSSGLVYLGGEIAVVPETTLMAIQSKIEVKDKCKSVPAFIRGEKVSISLGIFAGYEAMFESQVPGSERAKILLTLLRGTQVKVELHVSSLVKQ